MDRRVTPVRPSEAIRHRSWDKPRCDGGIGWPGCSSPSENRTTANYTWLALPSVYGRDAASVANLNAACTIYAGDGAHNLWHPLARPWLNHVG
jgi:hypothetical protein